MLRAFVTKSRVGYACLLALALGLPAYRRWVIETTVWTPLDLPFPLKPSVIPLTEFTIDRTGTYEIVLKVANSQDPARGALSDCLVGWDWGNPKWGQSARGEPCRVAPVVGLRWRLVSSDGETQGEGVVEGITDGGGFSEDESYRAITVLSGKRGERYRLEGETSLDARALAFAEPRMRATNRHEQRGRDRYDSRVLVCRCHLRSVRCVSVSSRLVARWARQELLRFYQGQTIIPASVRVASSLNTAGFVAPEP